MGLKKYNFKNLVLLIPLPVLLNFLINLNGSTHLYIGLTKYFSLLFTCIFYFFITSEINKMLNLQSYSLSIVYFLSSFFIFDTLFLPFTKNLSFNFSVFFIFSIWISFIFLKSKKLKPVLKILSAYLLMRIFNSVYLNELINKSNYKELNTDVAAQWTPLATMIYDNNYFYALSNNLIEGQGLFASHVQASMLKLNFFSESFQFIQINSLIFLLFLYFLFSDFFSYTKFRNFGYITTIALILNNDWLFYLFFNSLMIEGIVSFIFGVLILYFYKHLKNRDISSLYYFLTFSALFYTKEFASSIALLILIFASIRNIKNKNVFIGYFFLVFNFIIEYFYQIKMKGVTYTNNLDYVDLIKDFIFLRNLNFNNTLQIIYQFFIDKPTSYIYLCLIILTIFNFKNMNSQYFIPTFVVFLNFVFVNLLYISYWQNIEIDSSYRYINIVIYMVLVLLFKNIENIKNTQKL